MSERRLRAVPDPPQVSRHAPDASAIDRLDDLLIAAGTGSAQAFDGVYAAVVASVYRVALRVIKDPDMAQDVVQDAMVEVWRKAPEFDRARGTAKSWVLTIAHRRAVDRVRREQRQREQMEAEAAQADPSLTDEGAPEQAVVEVDFQQWQSRRVQAAMGRLSDIQREAIELAYYGGRTHVEVSEELGVPLGTAKTRIRDGLARMRDALEEV